MVNMLSFTYWNIKKKTKIERCLLSIESIHKRIYNYLMSEVCSEVSD